jgi:glycosyltransferase involved in cell wall biosynthesis
VSLSLKKRRGDDAKMRKILLITFYFPPVNCSGVHRPWALARHLPKHGYEPIVITAGKDWYPQELGNLETDSVPGVRTIRTRPDRALEMACSVNRYGGILRRIARILDPRGLWTMSAVRAGSEALKKYDVEAIISTSPPYGVALAAYRLKVATGLPWVADFQDPWAFATSETWLGGFGYLLDRAVQTTVFRRADEVVLNTPSCYREWQRCAPVAARKSGAWITNGFRGDMMPGASEGPKGRFRIVHADVFYYNEAYNRTRVGLRRRARDLLSYRLDEVDRSPQSAGLLLRAVRRVVDDRPELEHRFEIDLVGTLSESDRQLIRDLGLEKTVHAVGQVSAGEAARYIRNADVLYLPFWYSRSGRALPRVRSKTYEYMAACKPILVVADDGDVRNMIRRAGTGRFVSAPTADALAEEVLVLLAEQEKEGIRTDPDRNFIGRFHWERIAAQLAGAIDIAMRRREPVTPTCARRSPMEELPGDEHAAAPFKDGVGAPEPQFSMISEAKSVRGGP